MVTQRIGLTLRLKPENAKVKTLNLCSEARRVFSLYKFPRF